MNYNVTKDFLYPPVMFASVWLISLLCILLTREWLYPISSETFMIYFIGAVTFSIGGLTAISYMSQNIMKVQHLNHMCVAKIHKFLDYVLFITALLFPLYLKSAADDFDISNIMIFFAKQRELFLALESSERTFSLLNNLPILSFILAMLMYLENDGSFSRKLRAYMAIIVAFSYGIIIGSKANFITLILAITSINIMRSKNFKIFPLVKVLIIVAFSFSFLLLFSNFAYMDTDISVDTFHLLIKTVHNYWIGGLVAFDRIVQDPSSIESTQHLNRFFLETANGFGANFKIPFLHAEYTQISTDQETNVYTIYFSYYKDFGWYGLIVGMYILGVVLSWIYAVARKGNPVAMVTYGMISTGIILSVHAEHFILNMNYYIKMVLFSFLVYYGISRISFSKFHSFKVSND